MVIPLLGAVLFAICEDEQENTDDCDHCCYYNIDDGPISEAERTDKRIQETDDRMKAWS